MACGRGQHAVDPVPACHSAEVVGGCWARQGELSLEQEPLLLPWKQRPAGARGLSGRNLRGCLHASAPVRRPPSLALAPSSSTCPPSRLQRRPHARDHQAHAGHPAASPGGTGRRRRAAHRWAARVCVASSIANRQTLSQNKQAAPWPARGLAWRTAGPPLVPCALKPAPTPSWQQGDSSCMPPGCLQRHCLSIHYVAPPTAVQCSSAPPTARLTWTPRCAAALPPPSGSTCPTQSPGELGLPARHCWACYRGPPVPAPPGLA